MTNYLPLLFLFLSASPLCAQGSRWQWGIGTNVHISNPGFQPGASVTPEMPIRTGLSGLARYRLNRKSTLQWGPFRSSQNLFWETGLRTDIQAYAYSTSDTHTSRNFISFEVPLNLVLVTTVRNFPWWRKRRMYSYARLGGSIGTVLPNNINEMVGDIKEVVDVRGLRAAFHLSSGLLRKLENGRHSSVGIFARFGLTPLVQGQLSSAGMDPPVPVRSASSLFGLEWSCFFGQSGNSRSRLPEEPVDMILCPRF